MKGDEFSVPGIRELIGKHLSLANSCLKRPWKSGDMASAIRNSLCHLQLAVLALMSKNLCESRKAFLDTIRKGITEHWEVSIPELNTGVLVIPGGGVKNGEGRLVVMNAEARAVINRQRGRNPGYVFTYTKGQPVDRINSRAWRRARKEAGLPQVRVHDLKPTLGRRLRAKGVSH